MLPNIELIGPAAKAVSGTVTRELEHFLLMVFGPPLKEIGAALEDKARMWRWKRQLNILDRARRIVAARGAEPRKVPLKVLVPLLDGATLEEDESLIARWAELLANAATSGETNSFAVFVRCLEQLTPTDARVLEHLHARDVALERLPYPSEMTGIKTREEPPWGIPQAETREALGLTQADLDVSLDNLVGLGLVEREPFIRPSSEGGSILATFQYTIRLTGLGQRFTKACQPAP